MAIIETSESPKKYRKARTKLILTLIGILVLISLPFYAIDYFKERQAAKAEIELMGQICYPEYNPSEGKQILDRIQQKYKDCDLSPLFHGPFGERCSLIVFIPIDEYYNLSLEDKKKIMNYASSLIPDLKKHPHDYSTVPSTAPIYKMQPNIMKESTSRMSYNSCAIAIGPIEEGNYYKTGTGEQVYGSYVAEELIIYPDDLY